MSFILGKVKIKAVVHEASCVCEPASSCGSLGLVPVVYLFSFFLYKASFVCGPPSSVDRWGWSRVFLLLCFSRCTYTESSRCTSGCRNTGFLWCFYVALSVSGRTLVRMFLPV